MTKSQMVAKTLKLIDAHCDGDEDLRRDMFVHASSGVGTSGWYSIVITGGYWSQVVEYDITDIGSHAENIANEVAMDCGVMTESEFSATNPE